MIIGVGMFAIPFSFVWAGFWPGMIELALLGAVVTLLHLLYGEIVLATPEFHRMPGYVRRYLGEEAARISWLSTLFGTVGTLLAYIVVGSLFLRTILGRIMLEADTGFFAVTLVCIVAVITMFSLKKESAINGVLTVFEIAFIAGLSLMLLPHGLVANLTDARASNLLAPYGVLLFALSGASVVPDLVTVLDRDKRQVRVAIVAGSLIPVFLYALFAFAVVGVSGTATTAEAIAGLARILGGNIAFWASIAGFLAVLTSFIALSANFQQLLALDLHLSRAAAWAAASTIPFVFYMAGFQDFIAIASAVGVVAFGVDAVLFLLMGRKVRQKQGDRRVLMRVVSYVIFTVIAVGVGAELLRILL